MGRQTSSVVIVWAAILAVGCGATHATNGLGQSSTARGAGSSSEGFGRSRAQHYIFAHRVLPVLFFKSEGFYEALRNDGDRNLRGIWDRVGDDFADPTAVGSDQLNVRRHETDGREVFIITFPPPQGMPDAYFAAAVYVDKVPSRYITLERSLDPMTGKTLTILGEWSPGEDDSWRHGNFGPGPAPTPDAFLERVTALILGKTWVPPNFAPPAGASADAGDAIYHGKGLCDVCHGPDGKGDGEAGASLTPRPTDFTDPQFHASRTDGELFFAIKDGVPHTGMISMNPALISDDETWDVIAYIRSLNGR